MTEKPKILWSKPTPGQFVTTLHCWIATYSDGTEGIVAFGLEGIGITPLMSSHRAKAEAMEPMARQAQQTSEQEGHRFINVRLVTFTSTETRQ